MLCTTAQLQNFRFARIQTVLYKIDIVMYTAVQSQKVLPAYTVYTLNNIGSFEGTPQYYYHATPGEPLQGSPGAAW